MNGLITILSLGGLLCFCTGCHGVPTSPTRAQTPSTSGSSLSVHLSQSSTVALQHDFCIATTHLSGDQEVPPRETPARGQFQLQVGPSWATYRLIVANIENVVAAHIHLGSPGSVGPRVVSLYTGPPGAGSFNGILADGTITSADFITVFEGQPWSVFAEALASGSLYVNVHTNDGIPPIDTGPGDFGPLGEIRGHLDPHTPCR